ncbi:hypothetical protein [Jatrophihabitans endophyticus]|uniref:hypothetical protein n=1 Tax=Jatrophihabitans endophyticus TaxID=1206085 RepID=UPI0019E89157|nr:hypothetical protein [Jatrophihabitans endophyticus]MBE7188963.1 hypothetical protein [Jatrophihabitans endophyticus]
MSGPSEVGSRFMLTRAAAAMGSQVANAGTSLALQLIAAHSLGLAGYGAFALCLSLLTTATALYTGYVGDGIVVLGREAQPVRTGLATSALTLLGLSFAAAVVLVFVLHLGGAWVALTYAVMVVGWLTEETGRRILEARLEFFALVLNDTVYAVATLATVAVIVFTGHHLTLLLLLFSMTVGAVAAIATATVQLPAAEYRELRLGRDGVRTVARFSIWRSLQASLRPTQLLLARIALLQLVSLAAVGGVEAGRLVMAPVQTVINGAGGLLLSTSAQTERGAMTARERLAEWSTGILVAVTVLTGLVAGVLAHPVGVIMTGHPVPPLLIFGWTVYLTTWAAVLPCVTELVARKLTRTVFNIRVADTVIGLAALLVGLACGSSADWTPWLLSIGGVVSAWWMWRETLRSRQSARTRMLAEVPHA